MPNTYTLISSNVLSGTAASVTFSSIPSTYTDLVLKCSARANDGTSTQSPILITFNGSSVANYSVTYLRGDGASVASGRQSNATYSLLSTGSTSDGSTVNTYANDELYIPNYSNSAYKVFSAITAQEQNVASPSYITATAGLQSLTNGITSITLTPGSNLFVSGSSFYLYGIKNS